MSLNSEEIIDSFLNLDSLPNEAKSKLTTLKNSLLFVSPEYMKERLFYDFKSQQGLCSILQEHGGDNKDCIELYSQIVSNMNRV